MVRIGYLFMLLLFMNVGLQGGSDGIMNPFLPNGNGQAEENLEVYQENMEALVHESVEKLNLLGIKGADVALEQQIKDSYREYPGELMMELDLIQTNGMVLSSIGMGNYDYETYEWSPSSDQIYSFDVEVFDLGRMYTIFLQGVSSIVGDDAVFTNIEEDTSGVDYENGSGVQVLRFHCNGHPYEFFADVYNDWFDVEILSFMNDVFQKEGLEKKLLITSDGYQQCILFYNTQEWAKEFEEQMGYGLE